MSLSWDDITEEELKHLYYDEDQTDRQIADIFDVTIGKVTYKRRKFGITIKYMIYQEFMNQNSDLFNELNSNSKERLLKQENIDFMSKQLPILFLEMGR